MPLLSNKNVNIIAQYLPLKSFSINIYLFFTVGKKYSAECTFFGVKCKFSRIFFLSELGFVSVALCCGGKRGLCFWENFYITPKYTT